MSASRGDLLAWLGSSCSPVMNKSINRLSLQEEKGGCFQPVRRLCQVWVRQSTGLCVLRGRTSRVSHGSLQAPLRKARDSSVRAGCGGEGCHVLFWCKAVCYNNDPSGKQSQKDGLNKEQREKWPFPYSLCCCLSCYKHCLTRYLHGRDPSLVHMRPDPVVIHIQWSWCQWSHVTT